MNDIIINKLGLIYMTCICIPFSLSVVCSRILFRLKFPWSNVSHSPSPVGQIAWFVNCATFNWAYTTPSSWNIEKDEGLTRDVQLWSLTIVRVPMCGLHQSLTRKQLSLRGEQCGVECDDKLRLLQMNHFLYCPLRDADTAAAAAGVYVEDCVLLGIPVNDTCVMNCMQRFS